MIVTTAVLTLISLIAYLFVGFSSASRARTEKSYFVADQNVSTADFANVTVGYGLQMAALFLFAYWGFVYGIGALWTALFWGIGYFVLYVMLPRFQAYRSHAAAETLHSFIRRQFRSSRALQVVAAGATLIGLMGTMLAEVDYTVALYQPITTVRPGIIQALFLIFGLSYVIWNGYQAEVRTERLQVPIAYCGILAVLLLAFPQVYKHGGVKPFLIITSVTAFALVLMLVAKIVDITATRAVARLHWTDWQAIIPATALIALAIECLAVYMTERPGQAATIFDQPVGTQLVAQGAIGLLSLFVANAFWMPVDVSTWQRVGSVRGEGKKALQSLRRGTFRVMLESPAGWCLGAVLGWTIAAGGYVPSDYPDPFSVVAAFAQRLFEGSLNPNWGSWQSVAYPVFVVACVAIMLSTITSILSAVSFTADRDLLPDGHDDVNRVRGLSAGLLLIGFLVYEGLRSLFQANLAILLYGAYSAQLALVVTATFALYERRLSSRAALWSIVTGLAAAAGSTAIALMRPDHAELAVLPPLFAVAGALVGYVVGYQLVETESLQAQV